MAAHKRLAFFCFIAFLVVTSCIRIGYLSERVMRYDQQTAGPFLAHLLAEPDLYDDDLVIKLRPLGFLSLVPLSEAIAFHFTGLDPLVLAYIFMVAGNLLFIFALFWYARLYLSAIHAAIAALIVYALRIDEWNLAALGNSEIYPTSTDLASSFAILTFAAVLRGRWRTAIAFIFLMAVLHPVHALFTAIPCALAALFDRSADIKKTASREIGFAAGALVAVSVPALVLGHFESHQVSMDYFLPLLYGTVGHANAWLNTAPFLRGAKWMAVCGIGFILFSRSSPTLAKPLFFCTLLSVTCVCLAQWIGITYQYSFAAPLGMIAASRCSVYVSYLGFPLLYRGIVLGLINRLVRLHKNVHLLEPLLLVAVLIFTLNDCIKVGKDSHSSTIKDQLLVSKWMYATPPKTHFIVTERAFVQDSFALRPTEFPLPYFISQYRIRDEKAVQFNQDMVQFWGTPTEHGRKWLENYMNDIEYKKMPNMTTEQILALTKDFPAQYFITVKKSSPLPWPVALATDSYLVYKIPETHS